MEQRADMLKRKPKFSSPIILAFTHAAVTTYPEIIPYIEKPLYVERAFKFVYGSYLHIIERASKIPVIVMKPRSDDSNLHYVDISLEFYIRSCIEAAMILLAQYYSTGDEKYISMMDNWFMFKNNKIHRKLALLTSAIDKTYVESVGDTIAGDLPDGILFKTRKFGQRSGGFTLNDARPKINNSTYNNPIGRKKWLQSLSEYNTTNESVVSVSTPRSVCNLQIIH